MISEHFHSYTSYDQKVGTRCQVLVTEISHDNEYYVAHNKFYEQVLVPKMDVLMGKMFEVEIIECNKFSMKGKVVHESLVLSQRTLELKTGQVTGLKNQVSVFSQICFFFVESF